MKPWIVRGILSGKFKGNWGEAHRVAVVLGTKEGVVVSDDMPLSEALRAADTIDKQNGRSRRDHHRLNREAA